MTDALAVGGETITVRGASVTAIVSNAETEPGWSSQGAGSKPKVRLTVMFPLTSGDYSPALRVGEAITVRGVSMAIEAISTEETAYKLTLARDA